MPDAPAATQTPAPAATPALEVKAAVESKATPGTPNAPASKTLLDGAGETPNPQAEWIKAAKAYQEDPTDEAKEALDKAISDAEADMAKPKAVTVPEKYSMTAAEGQTLDEALLSEVSPILKEAGLSNDQLGKLAPIATKIQEKAIAAYVAQEAKNKSDLDAEEIKASKQALGAKWQEQMGLVAKARDRFFSAESKAILSQHGNNIHLIQDLVKLGTLISEGKFVDGKPVGVPKTPGQVLFDNTK